MLALGDVERLLFLLFILSRGHIRTFYFIYQVVNLHSSSSILLSRTSIILLTIMVSRKLMGVWLALDTLLLISGLISVILSQIWRVPDAIMRMVLSRADLAGSWNLFHLPWLSDAHSAKLSWHCIGYRIDNHFPYINCRHCAEESCHSRFRRPELCFTAGCHGHHRHRHVCVVVHSGRTCQLSPTLVASIRRYPDCTPR